MSINFVNTRVSIPSGTRIRLFPGRATFGSTVRSAGIAVNGFKLEYDSVDDHHINEVRVDTQIIGIFGNIVDFHVKCHYTDKTSENPYSGEVVVLVIAETQ